MGKQYNTIYADPPWTYGNVYMGRKGEAAAGKKYGTMSIEDIKSMPLDKMTCAQAILFLWVTVPLLPYGLTVMDAWGFRYITMLTWRKLGRLGMGSWFRVDCEHLMVGVKGNVKAFHMQRSNFYQCKSGVHSRKPDYFRQLASEAAMKSFDEPMKLELFARTTRDLFLGYGMEGWDVFGDQADGSIDLPKG
jgi:N6-adenosine-specific RNA methylase IME4